MTDTKVTRIDLAKEDDWVIIRMYKQGWKEGDEPDSQETIPHKPIFKVLESYEKEGFTVEMCDAEHGRALRGPISRIDFFQNGMTWTVKKYPEGWTAKTRPIQDEVKPEDFDINLALEWCRSKGWIVRTWPGGARAFKGAAQPVRDGRGIKMLRHQIESNPDFRNLKNFDLAFDC